MIDYDAVRAWLTDERVRLEQEISERQAGVVLLGEVIRRLPGSGQNLGSFVADIGARPEFPDQLPRAAPEPEMSVRRLAVRLLSTAGSSGMNTAELRTGLQKLGRDVTLSHIGTALHQAANRGEKVHRNAKTGRWRLA